mgnify:CR=1 FL=1
MQIVLHSDDILLMQHWEKSLHNNCVSVDDLEELYLIKNSLIVINYSACDGKCDSLLRDLGITNKVLVLHRTPDINTAKHLLSHGAKGYGNALMRDHFLISAVETIKDGMIWLYPEFTSMLILELPEKENKLNFDILNTLSEREKEVALLLKDGLTYKEIGEKLDITPRTVKAHSAQTYKKLAVKDRLGLALLLK